MIKDRNGTSLWHTMTCVEQMVIMQETVMFQLVSSMVTPDYRRQNGSRNGGVEHQTGGEVGRNHSGCSMRRVNFSCSRWWRANQDWRGFEPPHLGLIEWWENGDEGITWIIFQGCNETEKKIRQTFSSSGSTSALTLYSLFMPNAAIDSAISWAWGSPSSKCLSSWTSRMSLWSRSTMQTSVCVCLNLPQMRRLGCLRVQATRLRLV